jgi:hypothetical protein
MTPGTPETYRAVAERSWRWVQDQVRWDDGPWVALAADGSSEPAWDRDGMHSGIGGLAHALAEIRLVRPWTGEEDHLATAIADRLRRIVPGQVDCTVFDGLAGTVGALVALGEPGVEDAMARLATLAADGWPQTVVGPPRFLAGGRLNDLTLGTAGVLLSALWALRHGVPDAREVAEHAAGVLLAEEERRPSGSTWPFVPLRFRTDPDVEMPNLSHGVAGVAAALAVAGAVLARPDLTDAARRGAEHLVSLANTDADGFVVPVEVPAEVPGDPGTEATGKAPDRDEVTYTWCHGPTGTSLLFLALQAAGVDRVAGEPTTSWHRRCLHSVRGSGVPERLYPGFWDNDGRCCGTAGVGEVFLDSWHRAGQDEDRRFAVHLADTLLDRAVPEGPYTYWRFLEHRAPEPLLPPGVGWMQGAAGISAFLFRLSRLLEEGRESVPLGRMDTWWALPSGSVSRTAAAHRSSRRPGPAPR